MATVVVGVDGSEASRAALRWAAAVAGTAGDHLRVVSSWQYPASAGSPFGSASLPAPAEVDRETTSAVREVVAEELGDRGDLEVVVRRGPAADVLLDQTRHGRPSMLVLGARGLGGFDGLLLGSVTQQCVEHSPVPVVVIRGEPARAVAPRSILVGVDGSEAGDRARDWALDLAAGLGASMVLVHSVGVDAPVAARDRAQEAADGAWSEPARARGVEHTFRVEHGDPRSVLARVATEVRPDLVVVGTRGMGPVRGLLLGSVAGFLVRYAEGPIAVVPPPTA